MTFSSINIGSVANDGTGDAVRTAFDKINSGILALDSQTYFNTRLAQSNVFVGNTFSLRFANLTQRLHANVFSANTFAVGDISVSSNITSGNLIVPPGGFIYGTVVGSVAAGALDATTLGLLTPAAANVTQFNVLDQANIYSTIDSISTATGALTVSGGVGVGANINIGGNLIAGGNANVASLAVSGQVNSDLYFWGKTVFVDGSPVQTAAQAFTGGNITNATRFLSTTQSTSSITGAVRVAGGLGVAGNVNIGSNIGVVGFAGFGAAVTVIDRLNIGPASNVVIFGGNGGIRGTVVTAAQPGITSVGSLSGLSMSGNITAGSSNTHSIGDASVPFLDVFAFRTTSAFLNGQLTTASQPAITAVGTLGALSVTGNIAAGNVSATNGTFTDVQGTILTASQTNITAVGTLGSLAVTGNISANNVSINNTANFVGPVTFNSNAQGVTAAITDNSVNLATTEFVRNILPAGIVVMWSGAVINIPNGWFLCDGANSTPDLRDRFVIGAGSTYAVDATGGSANAIVVSHTHTATVTDPGHVHQMTRVLTDANTDATFDAVSQFATNDDANYQNRNTDSAVTGISVGISTIGSSGTDANLPPYYALCYIMKA
jgi:hypothetical protein